MTRFGRLVLFFAALLLVSSAAFHALAEGDRSSLGPTILRTPVLEKKAEQGILTPVPIQIELPLDLPARRVLVHYRIHGSKDWTTLELLRVGQRFSGAIPCLEVSTITGDIVYYIRVHDAAGEVIAYSGSRHQPYRVSIVHDSLRAPNASNAGRCPDPTDCPPGLPGCPSEKVEAIPCKSDADCEGGMTCGWDGTCEHDPRSYNWLGLELEAGFGAVPTTGACSVASQENEGYSCHRTSDGAVYTGNPVYTNEPWAIGPAPLRVVLAFDRLVAEESTLGVRLGFAFLGEGPTPPGGSEFVPYSAEVRASHFWGKDPFAREQLRPYSFIAAGYAMYDVKVSAHIREDPSLPTFQGGNDLEQTLEVWKRAGDGFAGVGSGVLIMLSPKLGISGEVRAAVAFPFGALLLTGNLGAHAGF